MKTGTEFVHLHVHSDYSLCDSTAAIKSLVERAEELGMKHLALTDHGNMFGIMDFINTCKNSIVKTVIRPKKNPINPIIGCEVYVAPGSRFEKEGTESENRPYHLVLLASTCEGYFNLIKLCSFAYTEGFYFRPRVDDELLKQYHDGLIALSGCKKGGIPALILEGKTEEAQKKACYYRNLFGENNFYLEIQDQELSAEELKFGISQKELNKKIVDISRHTGIPLVATNDVHYIKQTDAVAHDVLLCIGTAKRLSDENRKKFFTDQFYFKTADEMAALFPDDEYPGAVANTVKIAQRCIFDMPNVRPINLPDYLPKIEIPQNFTGAEDYLCHAANEGLGKRYYKEKEADSEKWKEIQKRLDYELINIIKPDFSNYFLIVADYVNWAKEHDIPVGPGRGSGAGSITAYALGITDIDPVKYDLLFERCINPERICMPDFDIDFGNEGREEVIKYITEKYGKEHVGRIITFGIMGAKTVIKDIGRVLSIPVSEIEEICKLIPNNIFPYSLKGALDDEPKLKETASDPKYSFLFSLAGKLDGLHRHSSVHAATPCTGPVRCSISNNILMRKTVCGISIILIRALRIF